ncbi:MAG: putative toxin-antitoxin system toxin component, PIN family [Bacteroides sp.]|nr:putative toxin-antitoxin system toxin component, PIN family [Bacteroides sp.]
MNEKETIYAVIDTNVLVSALISRKWTSHPFRVIESVLKGVITPLYNHEIITEYRDVLSRKKFNFDPAVVNEIISFFIESGIDTARTPIFDETFPDADDIVFYEITMSVDGAYLVTGNTKHFPERPFVITPTRMIEILIEKEILNQ